MRIRPHRSLFRGNSCSDRRSRRNRPPAPSLPAPARRRHRSRAQPAPPPLPPPPDLPLRHPQPAPAPSRRPSPTPPLSPVAASGYDRRDALPNVYLADGQASIRLRKLIKNVLFESQIDYKFVTGDISTFLRYKYYAQNFTYKIGVFDTISFGAIGSHTDEFERVRGGLLLLEVSARLQPPLLLAAAGRPAHLRRLTRVDNRKNNIYTKLGYQYGTEFDEQLNAIVGESRGRLIPVLTAFRELGPQKFSYAAALTESARISTGDYKYTKFESGRPSAAGTHRRRRSSSRARTSARS